jgi:hypothetical protein
MIRGAAAKLSWEVDLGVRIVAAAAVGLFAFLVGTDRLEPAKAGAAAGLVTLGLLILAVPLRRLALLKGVKAFNVELEIAEASIVSAPSARLDRGDDDKAVEEIVDLQLRLQLKLAYVAKHVIGFEGTGHWAPFLTVGSLGYDTYLDPADAVAANDLLTLSAAAADAASAEERAAYLKKATPFVKNIRATIFANVVKSVLEKDFGFKVGDYPRGRNKRKDWAVALRSGEQIRITPIWPTECGGWWNEERVKKRAVDLAKLSKRALIVVPPNGHLYDTGVEGVEMVRLDKLVRNAAAGKSLESVLPS